MVSGVFLLRNPKATYGHYEGSMSFSVANTLQKSSGFQGHTQRNKQHV